MSMYGFDKLTQWWSLASITYQPFKHTVDTKVPHSKHEVYVQWNSTSVLPGEIYTAPDKAEVLYH